MYKILTLFLLFFNSLIFSQLGSIKFNIPISISFNNSLSIKKVAGNIDFGEVLSTSSTQTLTKEPEYGVLFEVNGIRRERISVDYSDDILLNNESWLISNSGNSDEIAFISNVRHTRNNETYIDSKNLRNGRTIRLRNSGGIGKLFIWVGGELDVKPNQEVGDYEGTFNITVAY